jgi:hypothetical protein
VGYVAVLALFVNAEESGELAGIVVADSSDLERVGALEVGHDGLELGGELVVILFLSFHIDTFYIYVWA